MLVSVAISGMNRRRCLTSGLRSLDIDDLVIDFVLAFVHDEIYRRRILKDDERESSRIARVPIPHDIHRGYGSELFEMKSQGLLGGLPGQTANENLGVIVVVAFVLMRVVAMAVVAVGVAIL